MIAVLTRLWLEQNLAAVQFEEGKYDECIATCERAVEEGMEPIKRLSPTSWDLQTS
jgi:predicted negative regulator of RcsB-dependent stress response